VPQPDPPAARSHPFVTTRWSLVFSAADPDARDAREQFARLYAYPLYAFARRKGLTVEDAEDAVQGFLSRLMVGNRLGGVRPEGGRFRSYLLAGFRNFLVSLHRHDTALERMPAAGIVFLEGLDPEGRFSLETSSGGSPETEYDRQCARTILELVEEQLRREYSIRGQDALFEHFLRHLTEDPDADSHAAAALRMGRDPGAIRNAMVAFRSRFGRLFREHVEATLETTDARLVEDELRHLYQALGG